MDMTITNKTDLPHRDGHDHYEQHRSATQGWTWPLRTTQICHTGMDMTITNNTDMPHRDGHDHYEQHRSATQGRTWPLRTTQICQTGHDRNITNYTSPQRHINCTFTNLSPYTYIKCILDFMKPSPVSLWNVYIHYPPILLMYYHTSHGFGGETWG
jgi:hypothetical protein